MTLKPNDDRVRDSILDKVVALLVEAANRAGLDERDRTAECHNDAGSLESALDAIVAKWSVWPAPNEPVRARNPSRTRMARQRLSALRKGLRALAALCADPIYPAVAISRVYRIGQGTGGRAEQQDVVPVEDVVTGLQQMIEAYEITCRSSRAGRPTDHFRRALTKEVATVCQAHGVKFADTPAGPAAEALRYVFQRVPAAFDIGGEGLRPYLRLGREEQGQPVRSRPRKKRRN